MTSARRTELGSSLDRATASPGTLWMCSSQVPRIAVEWQLSTKRFQAWEWPKETRDIEWLYLARGPERTVKIGYSHLPRQRVRALMLCDRAAQFGVAGEQRLRVILRGTKLQERALHTLVSHERVGGEWFRGPDTELLLALFCRVAEPYLATRAS